MTDRSHVPVPTEVADALSEEARLRGLTVEDFLENIIRDALGFSGVGGQGTVLVDLLLRGELPAATFPSPQNDDGWVDEESRDRLIGELREITNRSARGVGCPREIEVGRGAQGEPWTFVEFIVTTGQVITGVSGVLVAPAVMINQWTTALPKLRDWLKKRRGRASLRLVKECCLDHAREQVENPDALDISMIEGHGAVLDATQNDAMDDTVAGPYCVSIPVPEENATFVYITDEVGNILHHHVICHE